MDDMNKLITGTLIAIGAGGLFVGTLAGMESTVVGQAVLTEDQAESVTTTTATETATPETPKETITETVEVFITETTEAPILESSIPQITTQEWVAPQTTQVPMSPVPAPRHTQTYVPPPATRSGIDPDTSDNRAYKNCKAVWNAIGGPIRSSDYGYAPHLDRDGDGVGCEQRPNY